MPNINIEIPEEIHKKIKIIAASEGIPLKELIVKALEEKSKELKMKV
ncbi:toxin-antitoxin system HicB family antitoxin [Candidatus Woesearchaeota archaeon]|nr:toxin-antitoxin system HicB family antitoxin [Candidatus Woesearchaeota archaeon]